MKKWMLGFLCYWGCLMPFSTPSHALPELNEKEMENWIHKHPFLEPDIFPPMGGYCASYAKRKLVNNRILFFTFTCRPGYAYYSPSRNKDAVDILAIYEYHKENKADPEANNDGGFKFFPLNIFHAIRYLDVWQRDNAGALEILKNVYDASLAEDFKQSKLVYKGVEYGCFDHGDSGYTRTKLDSETFKHECAGPMIPYWDIQLLLGQKYLYEVRNEVDHFNYHVPQEDEKGPFNPPEKQLIIRLKKNLPEILAVISFNKSRYDDFKSRSSPAKINF